MKVNVLGTNYSVVISNKTKHPILEENDGYCDDTLKLCVIDCQNVPYVDAKGNIDDYKNRVIRHELIHAFLSESGLSRESWASNEEIVDWIAAQFPKLLVAFQKVDAI